jgi:hypothetical protein
MKRTVCGAIAALVVMTMAGSAYAQATRTWVSGVGDDVNPCSRTAPCKTFAGAISKTAAGGIISVLDPGGFGAVTITKAITIDGGGIEGSILGALVNGVIINVAAADHVTLRNLTISGVGTGLNGVRVINSSGHVTIEHCTITGFQTGIDFNTAGKLYVLDSVIGDNTQFGAVVRVGKAMFDTVKFHDNTHDGLRVTNAGTAAIRNGSASGHTNVAFSAVGAGSTLSVIESLATANAYGIGAMTGGVVHVAQSTVTASTTSGLYSDGASQVITFGNNRLVNTTNGSFTGSASDQ